MAFKTIQLYNFRNLADGRVDVDATQVFLVGENGQGKTNFLESVYLLCYGSSFRTKMDREVVKIEEKEMSVQGKSLTDTENTIDVRIEDRKKVIQLDGKKITDRKQLLDHFPCIVFNHEDIDFISGPPERRRWFFNQTMSLYNPLFIDLLRRYSKIITMRNTLIKEGKVELLEIYDEQAASIGLELQSRRADAIALFNKTFSSLFHSISGLQEEIVITYFPSWKQSDSIETVVSHLRERRNIDMMHKTSTSGPHRDRIGFYVSGRDFARMASTGQRRLMSLILRVAQAKFFSEMTGKKPLLLLDDVLLELDAHKRRKFVSLLPEYEQAIFTFLPDERYENYRSDSTITYRVDDGALHKDVAV
jgi:DNA replication and repair protein RecF